MNKRTPLNNRTIYKLYTDSVLSTDQYWEHVLSVEILKNEEVLFPCRVFGDGDNNCLLGGPHYKIAQVAISKVELTLDLVPVLMGLLE